MNFPEQTLFDGFAAPSGPTEDRETGPEPTAEPSLEPSLEPGPEPTPSRALVVRPDTSVTLTGRALARYEREYVAPVRKLNATLSEVLDVDAHPDRDPEEALSMLRTAMDTFGEESQHWL